MVIQRLVSGFIRGKIDRELRKTGEKSGRRNDVTSGLVRVDSIAGFKNVPITNTPISDLGLYSTPNEPADPTDCARWPGSPYCGSTGVSAFPFSILPEIIATTCDQGVRLNGSFFYYQMPPVALIYRRPQCRNIVAPPSPVIERTANRLDLPDSPCGANVLYAFVAYPYRQHNVERSRGTQSAEFYYEETVTTEVLELKVYRHHSQPVQKAYRTYKTTFYNGSYYEFTEIEDPFNDRGNVLAYLKIKSIGIEFFNNAFRQAYDKSNTEQINEDLYKRTCTRVIEATVTQSVPIQILTTLVSTGGSFNEDIEFSLYGNSKYNPKHDDYSYENYSEGDDPFTPEYDPLPNYFRDIKMSRYYGFRFQCGEYIPPPPPPPTFYEEEEEMGCCDLVAALVKKVDALDKKIGAFPISVNIHDQDETKEGAQYKSVSVKDIAEGIQLTTHRVEVANKIIGIEEFPITVPETLVTETELKNGKLEEKEVKTKKIYNLTEFETWFFARVDEALGQFEIPIAIQDGIPNEDGEVEETKYIKVQNIAEWIGDMTGYIMNLAINSEANINISTRAMIEAGEARQEAIKAYLYAKANSEYLAYSKQEYPFPLYLSFTPGAMSLDKVLQVSETIVKGVTFNDSNTFQDHLIKLLEAAAITTAVNRVSLNRKGPVDKQIMQYLLDKLLLADVLTGKKNPDGSERVTEDFDAWADEAEKGFPNTLGVTPTDEPYGQPYEERPRIRRLGDTAQE